MWQCCKLARLHKGSQFCTRPDNRRGKPNHKLYWNVEKVLDNGFRLCVNLETREERSFSPRVFAWRFFLF